MAAPEDGITEGVRADFDKIDAMHLQEEHCHDVRR